MASPTKSKAKNNNVTIYFAIVVLLIVLGAAGYYIHHKNQIILDKKHHAEIALEIKAKKEKAEKEAKKREELQNLFDSYLNNFKDDLRNKIADYRKARKVLNNFKSPYNYETLEYTKENYKLFKKSIAPSLRQKAANIIDIFEKYEKKINSELNDKDNELQQTFLKEWKEMSQSQLIKYVDIFSKEEDLIQAYDDLVTFYYTNSKRYKVNAEENEFIFTSKIAEKMHKEILARIDSLSKSKPKKK